MTSINTTVGNGECSSGTIVKAIAYDDGYARDGNITGKSEIGIYHYTGTGQNGVGPHAVTSIDTTAGEDGGCTLARCTVDGGRDVQGRAMCYMNGAAVDQAAFGGSVGTGSYSTFGTIDGLPDGQLESVTFQFTPNYATPPDGMLITLHRRQ
ncbi:MAG: hypothetical protein ACREHV_17060 [Rhizomicrobium sp.]